MIYPPSLRFYAGGEKSVRGYKYKTLGPEDSSGNIVGGRYLLTGSIAWERQIADLWRVSAFYDIGNAMDNWSKDLAQGIGVGVGLVLPFGHATLELAYPLDDQGTAQYLFIRVGTDL
jgi:translocation and assembly module TamA